MYETPERKPIVYFYVVMAPLYKTQSPIQYWSSILTSGEQIKRLIFEVLIMEAVGSWCRENNGKNLKALHVGVVNMDWWLGLLMILAWVVIWVSFVFDLYLWSGSMFVFGLYFFSFFSFMLLWSRFEFLVAGFDLGRTRGISCNVLMKNNNDK